jgi:hypothetical protein
MPSMISTRVVIDIETGLVLERESYTYSGPLELACGATSQQKAAEQAQANLANEMSADYSKIFGENQAILGSIQSAMQPIIAAGPNQQGFSQPELTALQGQETNLSAQGAQNAEVAANAKAAAAGGGNAAIPSGANQQINAMVNNSAAQSNAAEQANITQSNYATGRQNFFGAESALASAPGNLENASSTAGNAATNSNSASMADATQIQQANDEWVGALTGMIGSLGGAALSKKW